MSKNRSTWFKDAPLAKHQCKKTVILIIRYVLDTSTTFFKYLTGYWSFEIRYLHIQKREKETQSSGHFSKVKNLGT